MKVIESAKVKLPFGPVENPKDLAAAVIVQVGVIQAAPDYNNQADVKTNAATTLGAANNLAATATALVNLAAQRINLETTAGAQVLTLQLAHEALRTSLNTASKGNLQAAKAWTGETQTRTMLDPSTDPPTNATAKATKISGMVRAKCKAEGGVICYLFQHGPTPTQPDSWAPPVISSGSAYDLPGQPLGQNVYFRIAVVRRKGGQGAWSNVLEVTVK
jgi:hypothetical protein